MIKTVKCRYSHCDRFHKSKELNKDQAVRVGKFYYHEECLHESETIKQIIDLFQKELNPNVVFSLLRKTINDIVYNKNICADYLLFGLKYYISKNTKITYPFGLYYIIQDKKVENAWKNIDLRNIIYISVPQKGQKYPMKHEFHINGQNQRKYDFENTKPKGFEDILE